MPLDERYRKDWASMSRHVRELFNYYCARCEALCLDSTMPEAQLQVHHIDENPQNNDLENLIPLCARCHLQIEHEARSHAPYQEVQLEFFTNNTYVTQMKQMRQKALQKFGGTGLSTIAQMTSEEYDQYEMNHRFDLE